MECFSDAETNDKFINASIICALMVTLKIKHLNLTFERAIIIIIKNNYCT